MSYPILSLSIIISLLTTACALNKSTNRIGNCQNPDFDREVSSWLNFHIPAIDVDLLKKTQSEVIILDAREREEYEVSHLPGALFCGFKHFDKAVLNTLSINQPIVVYCSIGYRSEKIAKKIRRMKFSNVSNLYGGIFEWTNRGYPLLDSNDQPTSLLHTYNEKWGGWVEDSKCEKIFH